MRLQRSQRSQLELRLPWLATRFRGSTERPNWNTEVFFPLFWFWACWIEAILTIGPIFTQIAWAMFAYLQKSVRRLVNCHQSRNGLGSFFFSSSHVSRGRACRWSRVHDVSPLARGSAREEFTHDKNILSSQVRMLFKVIKFNHERDSADPNDSLVNDLVSC